MRHHYHARVMKYVTVLGLVCVVRACMYRWWTQEWIVAVFIRRDEGLTVIGDVYLSSVVFITGHAGSCVSIPGWMKHSLLPAR